MGATDQGRVEDETEPQPMGVIRKKTASRGTEAGTKYHCDICSVDVTSTVRLPSTLGSWMRDGGSDLLVIVE